MICRFNKITHTQLFKISSIKCESSATVLLDYENIPAPKGLPLIGTTLALISAGGASRLHIYANRRHQELGPIFKDKIGPVSAIFLSDPELMRTVFTQEGKCPIHLLPEAWTLYNEIYGCSRGLFFMNGEEWLVNRRIMNKLLLKGDTKWIEDACEIVSCDLVRRWSLQTDPEAVLPQLEMELYRWSLHTMVAVLLGKNDYHRLKIELDPLLDKLSKIVHQIFETSVSFQVLSAKIARKFELPSWKRFTKTVSRALFLANELVSTLNRAILDEQGLLFKMRMENIHKDDLTRIIVDLVLAAGDTTAYTMCWILYRVAKNGHIQNKLRECKNSNLHLKNVIRETLRLYPVAPFLTRVLPQNILLGGYNIPAGTLIIFSIYTSGRDSKYFHNPEVFWPDRWLRENSTTNMQQVCIPFGFGARSCIGKKIADHQLQTFLYNIVQNFQLHLDNEEEVDMILKMVAVPSQPIRLKLNRI